MQLEYEDLAYSIIGQCLEIHKILGKGFSEIVYKDCLEIEFKQNTIPFQREKSFKINYKGILIPHDYSADFVVYDKIILEVKVAESISSGHVRQTLNYLAVSKMKVGLIVNFGENSLAHKRVIL